MSFREKYLKYKQKYLELKKELEQTGGFNENSETVDFDYKIGNDSDINSVDELRAELDKLSDLEGGDGHEEFDFDIKLDDEEEFKFTDNDELTDLDELFEKIDEDDEISDKEFKEFEDLE